MPLNAGGHRRADAVDAERAPVVAVEVEGDEVPAVAQRHEAVRLDVAAARAVVARAVVEPQAVAAPGRLGERHQDADVGGLVVGRAAVRCIRTVISLSVSTRSRSALGMTWTSLVEGADGGLARASGRPCRTARAARSSTATASSSSSSSGGSRPPAPRA